MPDPKLVPGTLYINRDRDYRTRVWGPYIKIGIVRDEREANARIREHQTGNPREVVSIHEFKAPMVEALETQLHHRFSNRWISGEWFLMDQAFVHEMLIPDIKHIIEQQRNALPDFEKKWVLKNQASNGVSRTPTANDQEDFQRLRKAEIVLAEAKLNRDLADLNLRKAVGKSGGIDGVLRLVNRVVSSKFDRVGFEAKHPDLWQRYQRSVKTGPKGALRFNSRVALAKLNPEKAEAKKLMQSQIPKFTPDQAKIMHRPRTPDMAVLHEDFIRSLPPLARAEWSLECLKASFASRLGEDEAIEGICSWRREIETKVDFDEKTCRAEHPDVCRPFLSEPSQSVSVKVNFHRPYDFDFS